MNVYAAIQGVNALLTLIIGLAIVFTKARKPVHLTYIFWAITIFLWTAFYFLWGLQTDKASALFYIQLLNYPACFIHSAYFHFALVFSDNVGKHKKSLVASYLISFILFLINANNGFMDVSNVRSKFSFPFWPHASPLLGLLIAAQIFYVLFSFYILGSSLKNNKGPKKRSLKFFLLIAIVAWAGGVTNWIPWYDALPLPPIANLGITFYILTATYLIFKHNVLELNLVIRRTFIYGLLTLFITLVYTLFIIASEKLFQSFMGYQSIVVTLFAALTIALLFNPLRAFLNKFVDKIIFGKNIVELSSENSQMRVELEKQEKMKMVATLAAGMAHEIKNPLTSIKTFAEYLPSKYDDPGFREKFKVIVTDEVERINNIVKQLLEFSKPREPELKPSSIIGIMDETLTLLGDNLVKSKINLIKRYTADPVVMADKHQLKQVFLNLFLNSVQAMPDGGALTVSTSSLGDTGLLITIEDTGVGISKESLAHIFDPFFTTKESGTGLGLCVVHGIIEKHGGTIKIKSTVGSGTSVSIVLNQKPPSEGLISEGGS